LPKKVSALQKKEILNLFKVGVDLNDISAKYNFSLITIARHLKNILGAEKFNELKNNKKKFIKTDKKNDIVGNSNKTNKLQATRKEEQSNEQFFEVIPITEGIDFNHHKEFASEPLKDANLPEIVYMLIDKNIELIPKMLREYPQWSFLPNEDLDRMTLEIFEEQKYAKKLCTKNQKLIKVPNSNVFLIASNVLKSKGISRIIFNNLLIAL
tara:strand:+ start:2922 stop:3554 length:633 start_codon:yes stop_codon:yes gene_type:complete